MTPALSDLYRLAEQLELDRDVSVKALKARDHEIGLACNFRDDCSRLLFWLQRVTSEHSANDRHKTSWLTEAVVAYLARILAFFFGFSALQSRQLSPGPGVVKVFVFNFMVGRLQFVMSVFSAWGLYKTVRGNGPVVLPVNPANILLSKIYPDPRYFREVQDVLRIAFLRYGQEMGMLFTVGAMAGFLVVLALSDFTFVWGSTFQLGDDLVAAVTDFLAAPWSSLLPSATVDAQLIAGSRFHPALTELSKAEIEEMRGWWPFLFMTLVCYALLPRVLLWLASRFYFGRFIKASFSTYPCSDLVLSRMNSPVVETQAATASQNTSPGAGPQRAKVKPAQPDARLFLVNWAGALGANNVLDFEEFAAVPAGNVIAVGVGSLADDIELATTASGKVSGKVSSNAIGRLLVVVKSWEPPMADLADFLTHFGHVSHCTVYPLALPGRPVTEAKMADWGNFSRTLPFSVVDVRELEAI